MSEMKTHVIDGKTYVEVDRKAEVGNKVVVIGGAVDDVNIGKIYNVLIADHSGYIFTDGKYADDSQLNLWKHEYRVLEPLVTVDTTQASPSVVDMLANLARRVSSLEQQLRDTQGNTETLAEELAQVKYLTQSNEDDIVMLDERTQPKKTEEISSVPSVFDLAKMKSFKLSELSGKTLTVYSTSDTADGFTVTTTVAIDKISGKMYVLESEVVA